MFAIGRMLRLAVGLALQRDRCAAQTAIARGGDRAQKRQTLERIVATGTCAMTVGPFVIARNKNHCMPDAIELRYPLFEQRIGAGLDPALEIADMQHEWQRFAIELRNHALQCLVLRRAVGRIAECGKAPARRAGTGRDGIATGQQTDTEQAQQTAGKAGAVSRNFHKSLILYRNSRASRGDIASG